MRFRPSQSEDSCKGRVDGNNMIINVSPGIMCYLRRGDAKLKRRLNLLLIGDPTGVD